MSSQLLVTGVQTSGRGPSAFSSHPATRSAAASPDDFATTRAAPHVEPTVRRAPVYSVAMSESNAAFSDDDTTVIDVQVRNGISGIVRASPISATPTTTATPYE